MPKKKKGKGGKKKKKSLSRGDGEAPEDGEGAVNTAMGALQADGTLAAADDGKKKKKKKKKKLTKSERAALKLEKAINAYMSQEEHYRNFIDTIHNWLTDKKNAEKMTQLFAYYDTRGENHVTYDEFKAGMRDLNIPCNVLELHILAKLLDKEDIEEIDYTMLPKGLSFIREAMDDDSDSESEEEEAEVTETPVEGNVKPLNTTPMQLLLGQTPQDKPTQEETDTQKYEKIKLIMSQRKLPACSGCKLGISEPYKPKKSKYIQLELKLATFANLNKPLPLNLIKLLPAHTTVAGLISLVVSELHVSSSTIAIFRDTSRDPEMALDPSTTLEENGYPGGSYDSPQLLTLYYDYIVEFRDCPLLMCDHYMRKVPIEQIMKSIKR
ncbi:uncharacterized protein LOC106165263 [Lingula anatina]|uniref:Uncharacterized protein LOC106165263 n=1 Tax=Lingula anatina TaxID=7574 RepID=A0A1S3ILV6_LINAN|nr:uncharacterized protein LOC106165263 [Lingula anatina]|eukprot:XP_013398876.1 uncharacterized protein LOC106165263 [Lingula anatina]